jgi:helix-turn-helix protein
MPRFGYRKIYHLLQAERWGINRETVRRLQKQEGLQVIKKEQERRLIGASTTIPTRANVSQSCLE